MFQRLRKLVFWAHLVAGVAAGLFILLMAAIAYWMLQQTIIASEGAASILKAAVGGDWKGKLSPVVYVAAILSSFWVPWLAQALYATVALLWLIPDRRIEHALQRG